MMFYCKNKDRDDCNYTACIGDACEHFERGNLDQWIDVKDEYDRGFRDALEAYAWWKDGEQYLGTSGTKLKEVINNINLIFNYSPPEDKHEV